MYISTGIKKMQGYFEKSLMKFMLMNMDIKEMKI